MGALYRSAAARDRIRQRCDELLSSWPPRHTTTTHPTSLGSTHLVEAGEGSTVCVYLAGTGFNAATSTPLLTELSSRCRVVAIDMPGQPGLSAAERPPDDHVTLVLWIDGCSSGFVKTTRAVEWFWWDTHAVPWSLSRQRRASWIASSCCHPPASAQPG